MTIKIKKVIRTDQWIVFIFVWGLFKRVELRDKINVTEHNRVITRRIMFRLSLWKNLQVSKLYIIFGAIIRLLKDPTVLRCWAKLTGIGYKEWRFTAAWTTDMYTLVLVWNMFKKNMFNRIWNNVLEIKTKLVSNITCNFSTIFCFYHS